MSAFIFFFYIQHIQTFLIFRVFFQQAIYFHIILLLAGKIGKEEI